jgi:hypothetical protein
MTMLAMLPILTLLAVPAPPRVTPAAAVKVVPKIVNFTTIFFGNFYRYAPLFQVP